MDKPQIICHLQQSLNYTLFESRWIPGTPRFVVLGNHARGTGAMQIYELGQNEMKLLKDVEKPKAFKCGTFGAGGGNHLATGNFSGNLEVWDMNDTSKPFYSVSGHKEIINAIDGVGGKAGCGAAEIVTASRDGAVKVWDPRQKEKPVAVMEPFDGEARRDCWTAAFGDSYTNDDRCIAAGYDNGDIKLFDLRAMALRWETNVSNGVCSIEFDRKNIAMNKMVATTLESKFHVFDMRTQHAKDGFAMLTEKAHKSTIWLVRHLPQNRDIFVTTGGTGTINLWKYNYPSNRVQVDAEGENARGVMGSLTLLQDMIVATQPISSFDHHPDKAGLCVCTSFDQTLRLVIMTKLNTI